MGRQVFAIYGYKGGTLLDFFIFFGGGGVVVPIGGLFALCCLAICAGILVLGVWLTFF